jgi:GT2 family glycosyltransferase
MNNDVLFSESIDEILDAFEIVDSQREIGILGTVLYFPDNTAQHIGVEFLRSNELFGHPFHPGAHQPVLIPKGTIVDIPAVTGAFMMMRSSVFESVGGFDERFSKECQDIDLCLRIKRLGKRIKLAHAGHIVCSFVDGAVISRRRHDSASASTFFGHASWIRSVDSR